MPTEMKLDKRNRAYVRVGAGVTAVLTGEDDITSWDDEELTFGRRRGPSGKFGGQPPRVIPTACLRELVRRKIFDTESVIREACVDAAVYLAEVSQGRHEPNPARMKACEMILDRFLGKPVDRVQMTSHVDMNVNIENAPWVEDLRRSLRSGSSPSPAPESVSDDDGIIDAEVVEDSWGVPPGAAPARSEPAKPRPAKPAHSERPSENDLKLWRKHHGPTPPPTDAAGQFLGATAVEDDDPILEDDDPTLTDDEDDFIPE